VLFSDDATDHLDSVDVVQFVAVESVLVRVLVWSEGDVSRLIYRVFVYASDDSQAVGPQWEEDHHHRDLLVAYAVLAVAIELALGLEAEWELYSLSVVVVDELYLVFLFRRQSQADFFYAYFWKSVEHHIQSAR
jgi:hypothetical protein